MSCFHGCSYDIWYMIYDTIYLLTAIGLSPGGNKLYKKYFSNEHHKPPRVKQRSSQRIQKRNVLPSTHYDTHIRTNRKARKQFPVNVQAVEKRSVIILVTRHRRPWNPTWVSSSQLLAAQVSYLRRRTRSSNVKSQCLQPADWRSRPVRGQSKSLGTLLNAVDMSRPYIEITQPAFVSLTSFCFYTFLCFNADYQFTPLLNLRPRIFYLSL
jgi:hypothetical protein